MASALVMVVRRRVTMRGREVPHPLQAHMNVGTLGLDRRRSTGGCRGILSSLDTGVPHCLGSWSLRSGPRDRLVTVPSLPGLQTQERWCRPHLSLLGAGVSGAVRLPVSGRVGLHLVATVEIGSLGRRSLSLI